MMKMTLLVSIVLVSSIISSSVIAQDGSTSPNPVGRLMFCHDYFMNKNGLREKIDRDLACASFMAGQGIETLQEYIAINCESIAQKLKNLTDSDQEKEKLLSDARALSCLSYMNLKIALNL